MTSAASERCFLFNRNNNKSQCSTTLPIKFDEVAYSKSNSLFPLFLSLHSSGTVLGVTNWEESDETAVQKWYLCGARN